MFESIVITPRNVADGRNPLDLGFLAEVLLFYQSVRVIADPGMFMQLIRSLGPELLLEFLDQGHLNLTYLEDGLAVQTTNANTRFERHDACVYSLPSNTLQELAPRHLEETIGRRGRARRLASRFLARVQTNSFKTEITQNAREDFGDDAYVQASVATILRSYAPEYRLPDPLRFVVRRDSNAFVVDTNLDFDAANRIYHQRIPAEHSSLTPAYLLSFLTNIRGHLFFAAEHSAEIATDPVNSAILGDKVVRLAALRAETDKEVCSFQDFKFDDGRALREAINSGQHNFRELLEHLQSTRKWKKWLRNKPPDLDLVKYYHREVTRSSWVDHLPVKIVRWSLFTGAGLGLSALGFGPLPRIVLSAVDTFLVDKLLRGWRPNTFVEKNLAEFVSKTRPD